MPSSARLAAAWPSSQEVRRVSFKTFNTPPKAESADPSTRRARETPDKASMYFFHTTFLNPPSISIQTPPAVTLLNQRAKRGHKS